MLLLWKIVKDISAQIPYYELIVFFFSVVQGMGGLNFLSEWGKRYERM